MRTFVNLVDLFAEFGLIHESPRPLEQATAFFGTDDFNVAAGLADRLERFPIVADPLKLDQGVLLGLREFQQRTVLNDGKIVNQVLDLLVARGRIVDLDDLVQLNPHGEIRLPDDQRERELSELGKVRIFAGEPVDHGRQGFLGTQTLGFLGAVKFLGLPQQLAEFRVAHHHMLFDQLLGDSPISHRPIPSAPDTS